MHSRLKACHRCGLVHALGDIPPGSRAACARCGSVIRDRAHPRGASRAAAFALAALLLYPVAMSLPVLTVTRLGRAHEASIWSGIVGLFAEGELGVGLIVLLCSVVAPIVKLGATLALSLEELPARAHHRAIAYRAVELLGRWGMLDVLLVALLVAAVKLGDLVRITPGPGLGAFAAVVTLSLLASACFDPHALWDDPPPATTEPGHA